MISRSRIAFMLRLRARGLPLRLAAALACLPAIAAAQPASPVPVTPGQAYQLALEARTTRDYPAMLSLLRQAGQAGDMAAQEMLGSVLLAGPALHGGAISADPCEAAQWVDRALAQGSAMARHQREVLNGLRDLPRGRENCG
ncbi:sel1 repeat family protein [Bordetella petrii]|uniref:sel1 repeat family protein n=1 Tax=Bordetella petrii TaxID=94624 RepID=UPI001E3D544E|nr:sel1 repeat family protein [Bordetella petrii]MCD0504362.1 sel1 repeat family protein [Bordetella petrii]